MQIIEKTISFGGSFYNSNMTPTYILGATTILFGVLEKHTAFFISLIVLIITITIAQIYILIQYPGFFINRFKKKFVEMR
jgi:hypothetical protein